MHNIEVKSILSAKNGMNLYRGCTHGCIYCDARSTCYQMDHSFEDIAVKHRAPQMLEDALRRKRSRCMIDTGAMSDPYLPEEATLGLTRRCLEIIERYGFGLAIQTKSDLILRDLDLLKAIHRNAKCVVQMTLTTYDDALCRIVEPNVCTTKRRAEVLQILRDAGIPTVVWMTPILPFLNDTEENLRGLLQYCIESNVRGIIQFGMGLTLRDGDRQYYYSKLDEHFPGMKERYIKTYGSNYILPSPNEAALMKILTEECTAHGIEFRAEHIFRYLQTLEHPIEQDQLSLY